MKKFYLITTAVLCMFAAVSCEQEEKGQEEVVPAVTTTTISADIVAVKAGLGAKEGDYWPNYWKTGDQISVNGVASEALESSFNDKAQADFTFAGSVLTPYCAAYPASAVSNYSAGSATVTIPASQSYVPGSYDPAAFLMVGKSSVTGSVSLTPQVSVIHLSLTGSKSINRVKLTGEVGAALSGSFTTDFSSLTKSSVSNVVELQPASPVALPAQFFICVPAGLTGGLQIEVFDSESGSMTKAASIGSALVAGKMYSIPEFAYAPAALSIHAEGITSSTAVICWDGDPADAYTIAVYSNNDCTTLEYSFDVPAGDACWGGNSPRFCISGLTSGTPYYVKVTNTTQSIESNVLPVTTAAFEIVPVTDTPKAVNDVILAEDFGELRWDCDIIGNGAGFFPDGQTSFANTTVLSYQAAATSSEKRISAQSEAVAASRLAHWGQGANPHMYVHPGYIKLVGEKKVTHLVTPALDNIPEGKLATLEVEVTACPYYSESSAAYATMDAIVAVQPAGSYQELGDDPNTNTLDLTTNIQPITLDAATAWKTYTVTLTGVVKGDRLAFGAAAEVTQNNARMNISDMKVTIKALEEPVLAITASVKSVSSSTAAFTWTYGGEAAADIAKPYTIALYSDSGCSNLVVSHSIEADASCWNGKTPCFVFGGLNPATEYWFVATDTEASISSDPVSATTEAFTPVDPTLVTNAAVGDVILAENFSEIGWGPDVLNEAAGFVPDPKIVGTPSGTSPSGVYVKYSDTGNRFFGTGVNLGDSRLSHGWGFFGNSSVYLENGYSRVGASGGRTHIVTPALSGIPAGKVATLDVTVTASKYDSSIDISVFAEKDLTINGTDDTNAASYKKYTGASLNVSKASSFGITSKNEWQTKTARIHNVDSDCQLIIGSLENYVDPSDSKAKNRFYISDVVVTIVSMKDKGAVDAVMEISDFTALKAFLTACEPGKVIQGNVTADIDLTSAQVEEIDALYPVAEFEGIINGNNHTISGLTKPLFAEFSGTASNLTLNSTLNITDAQDKVGIFAKSATDASLTGCVSRGSITHASATDVDGDLIIGGLVGSISGCTLTACQNYATVTNNAAATGTACIGGLVGVANGANDLSGNSTDYNYNQGLIIEDSATEDVAVGGVCGYSTGAASNFNYCKSLAPDDPTDYDDIEIRNNTKNKVYVGGIIGKSSVTSSMDYTYNSSDIKFTELKITETGQVFGGGIIGGWSASGEQTITGCE
ncbi:MAG: hypothetical protein J5835_01715, partial [Bacteroidales bacterium]|nr:hypothetical protein [Bacteroidales bacterium]